MRERIFRGSTRPPLLFGVPLLPMLALGAAGTLLTMWSFILLGAWAGLPAILTLAGWAWMRAVSHRDDQQLRQRWLACRLDVMNRNRRRWRMRSYAPAAYLRPGRRHDYL